MLKLLEFDYTIEYKKGKENAAADALSRKFVEEDSCQAVSIAVPIWLQEVTTSYHSDKNCSKLLQELALDPQSNPGFSLQSGILRYKGRIYIGENTDLRSKLFHTFHSSPMGGHSGNRVTLHKMQQVFYWPHFKKMHSYCYPRMPCVPDQ